MGMKSSTSVITPCELIREINDLCQGGCKNDSIIRQKLYKLEKLNKLMANKIQEHDTTWHINTWKEKNNDDDQDWKRRIDPNYKVK